MKNLLLARQKQKNGSEGFTLVELMIVIVIVGILSAIALPNFLNQTKKAAATEAKQQTSSIFKQAHAYVLENGKLGTLSTDCSAYAGTLDICRRWCWLTNTHVAERKTAFTVTAVGDTSNTNTIMVFTVKISTGNCDKGTSEIKTTGVLNPLATKQIKLKRLAQWHNIKIQHIIPTPRTMAFTLARAVKHLP